MWQWEYCCDHVSNCPMLYMSCLHAMQGVGMASCNQMPHAKVILLPLYVTQDMGTGSDKADASFSIGKQRKLGCLVVRGGRRVRFTNAYHDNVIKWKHFTRCWPFVWGIHRSQRPVTRSFDIFFDLLPNNRWTKQSWGWWFETPSRSFWRHCNATSYVWKLLHFQYCIKMYNLSIYG